MTKEIQKLLDDAEYYKVTWAPQLRRWVFQTFTTPDTLTQDEQQTGGGELPLLIEWLQQLNK